MTQPMGTEPADDSPISPSMDAGDSEQVAERQGEVTTGVAAESPEGKPSVAEEPTEAIGSTLSSLPDVGEPNALVFSTSSARIMLPSETPRHPRLHAALLFVICAASLGIVNGLDTIAGDSGLIRDRDFIYSQTQGPGSDARRGTANLDGVLLFEDGTPAADYIIIVDTLVVEQSGLQHMDFPSTATDAEGRFRLQGLNPGLNKMHVRNQSVSGQGMSHRILLSPPALFEPYGFTHLTIIYADEEAFSEAENATGFMWLDMSEAERGRELYDPTAAQVYDVFGTLFAGFGLLGGVIGLLAWRQKNTLMMRTAAVLTFFGQGYWYSACCLGLLGLMVTIGLTSDDG